MRGLCRPRKTLNAAQTVRPFKINCMDAVNSLVPSLARSYLLIKFLTASIQFILCGLIIEIS